MLRGDLKSTPLADLLRELSDAGATGCVYVHRGAVRDGAEAIVALRAGAVSNVVVTGCENAVAERLIVTGRLTPAALTEAREAQESELSSWGIPDLLIHLGLADEHLVCTLLLEQALADLSLLCSWTDGSWRFRRRERLGPSLPTPLPVAELLEAVDARHAEWQSLLPVVGGADAVVVLAPHSAGHDLELAADQYTLLCAVDGTRTVSELARAVGVTVLDAARAVATLVEAGLVVVESFEPVPLDTAPAAVADNGAFGAIADAFARRDLDALFPAPDEIEHGRMAAPWQQGPTNAGGSLADALTRVSAALSDNADGRDSTDGTDGDQDIPITPAAEPEPPAPPADVVQEPDPEQPEPGPEPQPEPTEVVEVTAPTARDDTRSHAALLLSQLADDPLPQPDAPPAAPTPAPSAPAAAIAPPRREASQTDTAALMRELSSLGSEDGGAAPVPVSRPVNPSVAAQQARKRKGLFGRG